MLASVDLTRARGCGAGAGGLRPVRPYKAVQEEVTALRAMLDDMLVRNHATNRLNMADVQIQ